MTRNYLHQWRLNRLLAADPCECGAGPRVGYDRGCKRCEAMDVQRYKAVRTVDVVRRVLARFDLVSVGELAEACSATTAQVGATLRHLVETGEVETVGENSGMVYRLKQRRAA